MTTLAQKENTVEKINAYIFVCSNKTEKECFQRMLFGTSKAYAADTLTVKTGDILFLLNIDSDVLYGVFRAKSDGKQNIVPEAWNGKYPYQVRAEPLGDVQKIEKAKNMLKKIGIEWHKPLDNLMIERLLTHFPTKGSEYYKEIIDNKPWGLLAPEKIITAKNRNANEIETEKPPLEATTLWDYPRQSYGKKPKGNNKYPGVTPAFVIWNMIQRYTEPGDLVLDPMCGSGTTLDVCKEEGRKAICYDIAPPPERPDIKQNDSRTIPLPNDYVDMIFIDSPYGDNIRYNDHPDCIGKISSETEAFYDELEKVMQECYRVLKPGKVIGWLIGDQWVKKKFTPVGFNIYQRLSKYFETVDIICVARRGQASHTGIWYNRARRFNFFLRGFKYLFIMRKPLKGTVDTEKRTIKWAFYDRNKNNT